MSLDDKTKKILKMVIFKYLNSNEVKVFVFGSRATNTNVKFSDIDLGLISAKKIGYNTVLKIEEELENSNIPYRVDVVDFSKVSDKFKEVASKKVVYLN